MVSQEQEVEANLFAICLLLEEGLLRQAVTHCLTAPDRPDTLRGSIDLLDDPMIPLLADRFRVSQQLVILRLCMLGYFAPYVKG